MALEIFRLMGSVFVDTDKATKSLHKVDKDASGFGKTLLKGVGTAAKWAAGVAVAAGTAGLALSKAAIDSYAEYEQLVGGVETLFGKSADEVMKYAQNAYKTAGMTANQYMETTTSFAAALLAGLNGDTAKAAKVADMAITDMSDNANKMGTAMESIQNAYQGFAKQNYSMLDNLKLGYGGTKKEMQRLLKDADAINAKQGKITKYSLDNLSDVYEAIHVIQDEMGITGTTAKEATTTISGQIGMLKARFENFKNTLGESLAPVVKNILQKLIDNLPTVETLVSGLATAAVKVVDFAMPYITKALEFIEKWFAKVPAVIQKLKSKLTDVGGYMAQKFQPILKKVNDWFGKVKKSATDLPAKLQKLKDKIASVGSYISSKFQPALDNLKAMFEAVKDKLQPFIDKLAEYVKSGEAAEDATEFMRKAGELLKKAFDEVAKAAEWVTDKVIEFSDWCAKHYKTIESITIVVGSFAAAWGLVNGALALWNGLAAVGAAVTGALAGAGTVLSGVVAFLTAPITLVIAAIGALIAVGVLLWRNWDTIKAKALELWKYVVDKFHKIKDAAADKFEDMKTAVSNRVTEMKDKVSNTFQNIYNYVVDKATGIYNKVRDKFEQMKSSVSLIVSNAKKSVTDTFGKLYDSVVSKANDIYNKIKSKFQEAKSAMTAPIEEAKASLEAAVAKIKDFFNFKLKIDITWPELQIYGGEMPWGLGGQGYPPSIDIVWHKKAMQNAMILQDPTIFGMNGAGQLLGAGEAGNEVVVGESHLLDLISKVVASQTAAQSTQITSVLLSIQDTIMEGNAEMLQALLAGHTIKVGEREFGRLVRTYA